MNEKYSDIEESASRLRKLAKPGQCKILSEGDDCKCTLCDIDKLVRMAYVARNLNKA